MTVRGLMFRLQAYNPEDQVMLLMAASAPEDVGHVRLSDPRRHPGVVLIEADVTLSQAQEKRAA